jgi:hypothetical protein
VVRPGAIGAWKRPYIFVSHSHYTASCHDPKATLTNKRIVSLVTVKRLGISAVPERFLYRREATHANNGKAH